MNPIDRDEQRGKQVEQPITVLSSLDEIKDFVISDECIGAERLDIKTGNLIGIFEDVHANHTGMLFAAFERFEDHHNRPPQGGIEDIKWIMEAIIRLAVGAGGRVRSCADEDKPLPDDLKHLLSFFGEERINRHCPSWSHKTRN